MIFQPTDFQYVQNGRRFLAAGHDGDSGAPVIAAWDTVDRSLLYTLRLSESSYPSRIDRMISFLVDPFRTHLFIIAESEQDNSRQYGLLVQEIPPW